MKIIPKYDIGSAIQFYVPGQIKRGILTSYPKGNNIYYNQDWNGYNDWHSKNIVLKGYNTIQNPENRDWEEYLKKGMDSWNDAGGFDWLYSDNPSYRQHRLQSAGTKTHQDLVIKDYDWLNTVIGDEDNYSKYNIPSNSFTADRFENGKLVGRNGTQSDNDFGVQTGNRRPTIHVRTGLAATREWDDYFKKLGYVGAYEYLDHWIPTKDSNKATRKFGSVVEQYGLKDPEKVQDPEKEEEGSLTPKEKTDPESFWSKLGAGLKNVAPDLLDTLRLAGNMINNQRVYNESMKAIKPNLQQSYHTYRQVVGDEATKQGYYRRAVQGEQKAAQPFTADADRQVAYMNEAKRIGDELRAQGDLADNQRIRETSAESAAHLDANRERDTAVANSNLTEMLKADAAKHQLTAQKYSADWTNLEQYLMGRQYKLEQKKAEQKELEKQLSLLDAQEGLLGDTKLRDLKTAYDEAYDAYYNEKDPTKKAALKQKYEKIANDYQLHKIQKSREALKLQYGKEGTKLERKRKDDSLKYLYRTSRDIVEHFRKMSKMTDDSRVRTMPKPIKLPSHPKKFQYGGVAPFTIYRPLGVGGESSYAQSTTSSSSSGKSEKDTAAKDKLDMIKELFKNIKGLPVDVAKVYQDIMGTLNKAKALGEELSTDDIASMYLSSMQKMAQLKYSEDAYEKAKALATQNEALNEIAVGTSGEMVFQNLNTGEYKIGTIGSKMFKDKEWNPLTNDQILELRAKSPNMVFNDQMFNIVNNGVGLNKISAEIKSLAAGLSTTDRKIEGISEVQSNRIKAGLQTLAGFDGTPDGYYKITQSSKDSKANVDAALNYIYSVLPTNYKTILAIHSGSEENSKGLILKYLTSQAHNSYEESISPLTGKASDKDGKDSLDKLSSNPLLAMQREIGGNPINYSIVTRDSNTKMSVNGTAYPALPGIKNDMSVDSMLSTSGLDQIVLSKQGITFGDQQLNPEDLKDVMYANSGRNAIVTLPCKIVNGVKQVNLAVRDEYEKAEQKAANQATRGTNEYLRILGQELKNAHLDSLLDSNGLPDKNMFSEFLIVEAYTTDKIDLNNKNSQYIEKVRNPSEDLENRINQALSTDNKKSNYKIDVKDKLSLFELTYNDVYRGTVFIPINNNPAAAMLNDNIKINQQQDLEELYQISNKSNKYVKDNSF